MAYEWICKFKCKDTIPYLGNHPNMVPRYVLKGGLWFICIAILLSHTYNITT